MKNKIYGSLLFIAALSLGYLSDRNSLSEESLTLDSQAPAIVIDLFDSIPCPSKHEIRSLFNQIKLSFSEENLSCDDPLYGRLAKTLHYSQTIRYRFPDSWPQQLQVEISNIPAYVGATSSKVDFDLKQSDSLAYNKRAEKEIYMGLRMFEDGPLEALGTLFHEARHSMAEDPGHVYCLKGDLPNYPGGCDQQFTLDLKNAGAYVYSIMHYFAMALYSENLSEAQREWALQNGLTYLSSRFNQLDNSLAELQDVLALVDTRNRIFFYEHESGNLKEFKYQAPKGESISRVDFSVLTGGLLFYTESGRLCTWSFYDKSNSLQPFLKRQSEEAKIFPLFTNRVYVPYRDGTYHLVYGKNSKFVYNVFDPSIGRSVYKDYSEQLSRTQKSAEIPDLKIFFQGLSQDNVMLDRNGHVYLAPHYADEKAFHQFEVLNQNQWVAGTGGVYSDGLYLIDNQGRLESFKAEYDEGELDFAGLLRRVVKDKDPFPMPDKIHRYLQGIHHEAVLGQNGKVYIRKREDPEATWADAHTLSIPNLKTIIMLRKVKASLVDPDQEE